MRSPDPFVPDGKTGGRSGQPPPVPGIPEVTMPKIVCVVPSIRPEQMSTFREAWAALFEKHWVHLITVWDGDNPKVEIEPWSWVKDCLLDSKSTTNWLDIPVIRDNRNLFCRRTDACRNIGFVIAAQWGADFILTLDDDVVPVPVGKLGERYDFSCNESIFDPIQAHLEVLALRVPISWMNTAHCESEYLRGVPYGVRDEAPVMLSHGVWVGTPDFDGETQLRLEQSGAKVPCECVKNLHPGYVEETRDDGAYRHVPCPKCGGTKEVPAGVPKTLPYFVGPVPRGVLFPLCGMNVMVRREALPYLYFAPMGADSGFPDLHRFADIFMGAYLKRKFDRLGWACYTGASTVLHTRASDATKNFEAEKVGRQWWEEMIGDLGNVNGLYYPRWKYFDSYASKRDRYADLIRRLQGAT